MKTKTKVMESTRHKSLSCKVCGSHDIKMQPVSQDLYVLWCESCSQDNRVEKTVAFATKEDLHDDSQIVYVITEKGREALHQIFTWIKDIQKYKNVGLLWKEDKLYG